MQTNRRNSIRAEHPSRRNLVLAVDIGGTKIEVGMVNLQSKIVFSERRPMAAGASANDGLRAVQETIDLVMRHRRAEDIRAIGVSVPGWINAESGFVLKAANLPCWRNYPLAQKLKNLYELPTHVENDANAAALAEAKWGAGRRLNNFFYVSLGTGIGTGIVRRDSLGNWNTPSSEGGHMTINYDGPLCPCGKRGCIEMYASGKAIARRARTLLVKRTSKRSVLAKLAKENPAGLTAKLVGRAAARGDRIAIQIVDETCDYLAAWLGNIVDLIEPDAIVLGGGLGRFIYTYAPRIRRALKTLAIHTERKETVVMQAKFGSQSALLGAAVYWLQND